MSDIVLSVENVYKRYRLGNIDRQAFKEDVVEMWASFRGKPSPYDTYITSNELAAVSDASQVKSRYVWALQDVNFEVKQGEIVGIIGKNGSGKSTLLKILSKTTAPTRGQVKIKGRIASLLEVGTGFHPELTGKQNIYLNGAILGMKKHEITRRLDEIIAFAGIEAFIDTPVKRYSSGMYVRLAFAVAAHLESDILIFDEVLAVGDSEFQKKCLGKMNDVSKNEGKTVLFVSHNMAAVQNLCSSGVLMQNGKMILIGSIKAAIQKYLLYSSEISKITINDRTDRKGLLNIKITEVTFTDSDTNMPINFALSGQNVKINIHYKANNQFKGKKLSVALSLTRDDGVLTSVFCNDYTATDLLCGGESGVFTCQISNLPLMNGIYSINLMINRGTEVEDWIQEAIILKVENGDFFHTGKTIEDTHRSFLINQSWN